ncbi:MAG: hypothetical protein NUV44_06060, partial [Candidatus Scalindua sp.]|nr:hypothetical protein [Candidatus Scalindua sp.]
MDRLTNLAFGADGPSETQIEAAIENRSGDPGFFQKLAESYAELVYPDRFSGLIPFGRNLKGQTISGWPDAYAYTKDGKLDAIEATMGTDWSGHLSKDLESAKKKKKDIEVAGFLFISWKSEPAIKLINAHKRNFEKLGIPSERITFVFRRQLVRTITDSKFAKIWVNLGIALNSYPFALVDSCDELFGLDDQLDAFAPARSEYENNIVHRPGICDQIEDALEKKGFALVRGRGASGKTVLAIQLSFGKKFKNKPVYYLDIASYTDSDALGANVENVFHALTTRASIGVLFIVDNIHQDERLAGHLVKHWERNRNGSNLLLLGREVSNDTTFSGRAPALSNYKTNTFRLRIEQEDLLGVYIRLLKRFNPTFTELPRKELLNEWFKLFGGDLIIFSSAIVSRIEQLSKGVLELTRRDAEIHVRERYLNRLDETKRLHLLIIAVFSSLEIAMPYDVLPFVDVDFAINRGIVFRSKMDSDNSVTFRLVHSGLGDLLLSAVALETDKSRLLHKILQSSPYGGILIANRQASLGQAESSQQILTFLLKERKAFVKGITANQKTLQYIKKTAETIVSLNIKTIEEFDEILAGNLDILLPAVANTPLKQLFHCIRYAENELPTVFAETGKWLANNKNLSKISLNLFSVHLGDLTAFFHYAKEHFPGGFASLEDILVSGKYKAQIVNSVLEAGLGCIAVFLRFTKNSMVCFLNIIVDDLEKKRIIDDTFIKKAQRASLKELTFFLKSCAISIQKVQNDLIKELGDVNNFEIIASKVSTTPLGDFSGACNYFGEAIPAINSRLNDRFSTPPHTEQLFDKVLDNIKQNNFSVIEGFMNAISCHLPAVYEKLIIGLKNDRYCELIVNQAIESRLQQLLAALVFAKKHLSSVYDRLTNKLELPENVKKISNKVDGMPLSDVVRFLENVQDRLPTVFERCNGTIAQLMTQEKIDKLVVSIALPDLEYLLKYLQNNVPELFTDISNTLASEDVSKKLTKNIINSEYNNAVTFLEYTETHAHKIFCSQQIALSRKENIEMIARQAADRRLGPLIVLLKYLSKRLPKAFNELQKELSRPTNKSDLITGLLKGRLNYMIAFLRDGKQYFPGLLDELENELVKPDILALLCGRLLSSPLDDLSGFIIYSKSTIPLAAKRISEYLLEPEQLEILADSLVKSELDRIVGLLNAFPKPIELLKCVNIIDWKAHRSTILSQERAFPLDAFYRTVINFGRMDIAESTAKTIILNASKSLAEKVSTVQSNVVVRKLTSFHYLSWRNTCIH